MSTRISLLPGQSQTPMVILNEVCGVKDPYRSATLKGSFGKKTPQDDILGLYSARNGYILSGFINSSTNMRLPLVLLPGYAGNLLLGYYRPKNLKLKLQRESLARAPPETKMGCLNPGYLAIEHI